MFFLWYVKNNFLVQLKLKISMLTKFINFFFLIDPNNQSNNRKWISSAVANMFVISKKIAFFFVIVAYEFNTHTSDYTLLRGDAPKAQKSKSVATTLFTLKSRGYRVLLNLILDFFRLFFFVFFFSSVLVFSLADIRRIALPAVGTCSFLLERLV